MILQLKPSVNADQVTALAIPNQAVFFQSNDSYTFILPSAIKEVPASLYGYTEKSWVTDSDIQLAGKAYKSGVREVSWGKTTIGGTSSNTVMIAGQLNRKSSLKLLPAC